MAVGSETWTLESCRLGSNPSCRAESFCATSGLLLDFSELVSSFGKKKENEDNPGNPNFTSEMDAPRTLPDKQCVLMQHSFCSLCSFPLWVLI